MPRRVLISECVLPIFRSVIAEQRYHQDVLQIVTPIRDPNPFDYGRLMLVSAIWGASFICIEIALADFSPFAIATWRLFIASLIILFVCYQKGLRIPRDGRSLILLGAIGFLNGTVPFTLIGWGQQTVDPATTALLLATSPFVALLLNHFMTTDDRFTLNRLVGLTVGFIGVSLLFVQEIVFEGNGLTGMLAIMVASACYTLSAILIRRLQGVPGLVIVAGSTLISSLPMLPFLLWWYPPWEQQTSFSSLTALLFLAIGPTAIAYVLRTQIVQINGAVFMSTVGYLIPLFAVLWSWLFFAETPTIIMGTAMIFVFTGIFLGRKSAA